jgi:hypothetical protein
MRCVPSFVRVMVGRAAGVSHSSIMCGAIAWCLLGVSGRSVELSDKVYANSVIKIYHEKSFHQQRSEQASSTFISGHQVLACALHGQ